MNGLTAAQRARLIQWKLGRLADEIGGLPNGWATSEPALVLGDLLREAGDMADRLLADVEAAGPSPASAEDPPPPTT